MFRNAIFASAVASALGAQAYAQDAQPKPAEKLVGVPTGGKDGQTVFNTACRQCHVTKEGDHRLGPSLHNVIGRKAGSAEGFAGYSSSLKNSGIVWDEATLDKWITNPESVVTGNNMKPYTGIEDAAERKTIIEFLKTQ